MNKEELFEKYKDIILSIEEVSYIARKGIEEYKAKLILRDGTNLRIAEKWVDKRLGKYSYYWLDEENRGIIGWDNAPHHNELENFPHHKHLKGERVFPSYETDLEGALKIIEKVLKET
ncbi:MAG: hypothetical protein KKD21_15785 [Proteobacteria bacterium]|nr:hypothetical protein [Pseudomonadota bacterium]